MFACDSGPQGSLRIPNASARCAHEIVAGDAGPLTPERRAAILHANERLAGEALPTLGVSFRQRSSAFVRQAAKR